MRNYIILNGISSNTISGLLISTLPSISKPKQRTTVEEIDGRDGDIVTKLGYSAYDKEIEIGLYGDFDIDDVIAYFNSEGTVTFSNEPDKFYNYQIIDQIDYEKLIRFKKANVKMHVQPFKYPLEETPVEITIQTVNNEAEEMDLDNTKEAPMTIALKGNTSQEGTPTPENPQDVHVVSGDNTIKIEGKNLFGIKEWLNISGATYTENNDGSITFTTISALYNTTYPIKETDRCMMSYKITNGTGTNFRFLYVYEDGTTTQTTGSGSGTSEISVSTSSSVVGLHGKVIGIRGNWTTSGTFTIKECMLEQLIENVSPQPYEPYQGKSYPINLGIENLLETKIATETKNGVTITHNEDGSYTLNGTATAGFSFESANYSQTFKAGTYIFGSSATLPSGLFYSLLEANTYYFYTRNGIDTATHTFDENTTINNFREYMWIANGTTFDNFILKPQLEKGSKANSYSEYGTTPIELCKIGTYQDYIYKEGKKWYLEKKIGKVVLNGSEDSWSMVTSGVAPYYRYRYINDAISGSCLCNLFRLTAISTTGTELGFAISTTKEFRAREQTMRTLADWKTFISNNNLIVYYTYITPTATEITDTTLISQLNALSGAKSYTGQTNISQENNDLAFILNATALQQGSGEATVENEGNIYSKPILDIEGSGTIGIYLDGNQMFSVDLSNATECIIDTAQLEAYNPSTDALMNRQVTGDYSNFKLNAGENQVSTTGDITKVTISNYTRYL